MALVDTNQFSLSLSAVYFTFYLFFFFYFDFLRFIHHDSVDDPLLSFVFSPFFFFFFLNGQVADVNSIILSRPN